MAITINREATWNNIGINIKDAKNAQEALNISGLNYEVIKSPIYLSNGHRIDGQFATKKKGTDEVFGIVGKDYTIVQNEEAFSFVDSIVPEGLTFEKAGETSWMVYVIASMPEQYIMEDKYKQYIIFQNSHSGATTLKAAICPLRIVCQNQFTKSFRNADNKISLRHGTSIKSRMIEAQEIMAASANYMLEFKHNAEVMATKHIDEASIERILDKYFLIDEVKTQRRANTINDKKAVFLNAYNSDDNQNFKGSVYGLFNAFSDYITHVEPMRKTENCEFNRFVNVTFNNNLMEDFMKVVQANI